MLCAHAMVDAIEPILQVAEDEVDDRHELFGHLGVAAFGNGVVIIAACPQAAIATPIVGDDQRPRHNGALDEATQRIGAAVGSDGQPHAPGVAAILPLVLRGAGLPVADFDGSSHQRLVVNASAFTTRPASNIGFVRWQIKQKRENGETLCVTAKSNLADRMAASLPLGRLLISEKAVHPNASSTLCVPIGGSKTPCTGCSP